MVLSFEFYFWQLFWNTLYIEWEGGYKNSYLWNVMISQTYLKTIIAEW